MKVEIKGNIDTVSQKVDSVDKKLESMLAMMK